MTIIIAHGSLGCVSSLDCFMFGISFDHSHIVLGLGSSKRFSIHMSSDSAEIDEQQGLTRHLSPSGSHVTASDGTQHGPQRRIKLLVQKLADPRRNILRA